MKTKNEQNNPHGMMPRPEDEFDLVVETVQCLEDSHPLKQWLSGVYRFASLSGYLRGGYCDSIPQQYRDRIEVDWPLAVERCRDLGLVSVLVQ